MTNTPPKKLHLFLLGAVAPLTVYVIFYAANVKLLIAVIKDLNDTVGFVGFVVVTVLFSLLGALCGGWALWCDSKTYKAAFSAGLGLPALIMSGSGALAPGADKPKSESHETRQGVQVASLAPYVPMFAAVEPSAFSRAFSIVFNPVGTVVKTETTNLKVTNEQLHQKAATLEQTNTVLIATREVAQTKVASLESKLTVVQQSEKEAVKIAESAKIRSSKLTEELASAQALTREKDQQLQEADDRTKEITSAVERLTREASDTKQKLAAASNDRQTMVQEMKRIQNTQRETIAEYDRVISKLVAVNLKSIPALRDELPSLNSEEVKTSVNKAFEQEGILPTPAGVRVIR